MLIKWKVSNFKSIRDETELDLGPLTIFAGANSSGKSTFIQSILLVAQTLSHKVGSRSVVLNGALTSLGQFDDLKSNDGKSDPITIKCTCRPFSIQDTVVARTSKFVRRSPFYYAHVPLQEIACMISFDADPSSPQRDLFQIQPRLVSTQLSCECLDNNNVVQLAEISTQHSPEARSSLVGINDKDEIDDQLSASLAYPVTLDDSSMEEVKELYSSATLSGLILRHFLPEIIVCEIDPTTEDAQAVTRFLKNVEFLPFRFLSNRKTKIPVSKEVIKELQKILKGTSDFDSSLDPKIQHNPLFDTDSETLQLKSIHDLLNELPDDILHKVMRIMRNCDDLYTRIYKAMNQPTVEKPKTPEFVKVRTPHLISESALYLDHFFSSYLKYLGPLRVSPKLLYPLAPVADLYDVGLRGEHTASILEWHKNKQISYIPSVNFKESVIERTTVIKSLEVAVIDWLQYLDVASSVQSTDQGKLGHELKVQLTNSGSFHDLTHVGVGVSQVLPILVMALLADTDSTLIFEQPELHLHPRVQTLLGDFFLSISLCNKQCIVETHSEYLIDRLRFRIAATPPEKELNSQTKIYFVEKPLQWSTFREVVINEYGAILDWPEGFFDQYQHQAEDILKAATMKRKESRRKNDA
jgi:predicted ATPase